MEDSTLYLEAAKLVDSQRTDFYGWDNAHHAPLCAALSFISVRHQRYLDIGPVKKVFLDPSKPVPPFWFGSPLAFEHMQGLQVKLVPEATLNKRKEHRVFALLLMAELAKEQGL